MAGKPKKRIDYAGWSVDIFSTDIKIDKLLDAQGWIGFGVYFYLCQMAFGSEGYFYEWCYDLCATTARKMGGGVGAGTVKETVDYCLQIGLFDKGLFDRWGVLTSRGIQRSYLLVLKSKNRKGTEIIEDYWLLDNSNDDDYQDVVFIRKNSQSLGENGNSLEANSDSLGENCNSLGQKKSKVNDIKGDNIYIAHSDESRDTESLDQFYESIWKLYPVKKGKGQVSKTKKKVLQRIGYEHIKRCIDRFVDDMEDSNRDKKYWMHGSTFFNGGYVDYLDENFKNDVKKNIAVQEEQHDEEEIAGDDWWKY